MLIIFSLLSLHPRAPLHRGPRPSTHPAPIPCAFGTLGPVQGQARIFHAQHFTAPSLTYPPLLSPAPVPGPGFLSAGAGASGTWRSRYVESLLEEGGGGEKELGLSGAGRGVVLRTSSRGRGSAQMCLRLLLVSQHSYHLGEGGVRCNIALMQTWHIASVSSVQCSVQCSV